MSHRTKHYEVVSHTTYKYTIKCEPCVIYAYYWHLTWTTRRRWNEHEFNILIMNLMSVAAPDHRLSYQTLVFTLYMCTVTLTMLADCSGCVCLYVPERHMYHSYWNVPHELKCEKNDTNAGVSETNNVSSKEQEQLCVWWWWVSQEKNHREMSMEPDVDMRRKNKTCSPYNTSPLFHYLPLEH